MTPLSDALSRLASASSAACIETTEGETTSVGLSSAQTNAESESTVFDCVAPGYEPPNPQADVSSQPCEANLVEPLTADQTSSANSSSPGKLRLYCDLAGDDQLAWLTASQSCDLVIHLDTLARGQRTTNAEAELALPSLHWPEASLPEALPGLTDVARVRLPLGSKGLAARDWVLLLDDCRQTYAATGLIVPASARKVLDWLAERCDEVSLVARTGKTDLAAARRSGAHLRLSSPADLSCLLVRAA